jgi:uncharacterized membrane protein YagU involved in acid resistance
MRAFKAGRAIAGGLAGTAAMTMLMLAAPMMGLPKMAIGEMLGSVMHIGTAAGWAMHGVIGVVLAVVYALGFAGRLPGPPVARGAAFGFGVFLLAQIAVTPMMGGGVFSGGNIPILMVSLMGHLVYGALVGVVYGRGGGSVRANS